MMARLPYPGLRAFRRDEADLFFGRDDEIDRIVERLTTNRFLGVLGASGSGKSSLVRTGLFESLEGGANVAGSAWQIVDCRPGGDPIGNLATALAQSTAGATETPAAVEAWLRRGPRSIVEWCEQGNLASGNNLLILVDQFEELFNYSGSSVHDDTRAFAALLVESVLSERAPIYVVVTMRSDYFGACGAYPELAKTISESIFLTPRMLRKDCRDAIQLPSVILGFSIEERLLELLLNDLEKFATFDSAGGGESSLAARQADQLPLMQYALNRMWQRASGRGNGEVQLRVEDYEEIGGLAGALDQQGNATIARLSVDERSIEAVFRALVKGPNVELATRDPHRIAEIAAISGVEMPQVASIVEAFADEDCQFLRAATPIGPRSYVDINHESLIRQWRKLSEWLKHEAEAAELWRHLAASACEWNEYGRDPSALLSGLQLVRRREWWLKENPSQAWAERYRVETPAGDPVPVTLVREYLDAGEAAQRAGVRSERRRQLRNRILTAGVVVATFAGGASAAYFENARARSAASFQAQVAQSEALRRVAERKQKEAAQQSAVANFARYEDQLKAARLAQRLQLQAQAAQQAAEEQAAKASAAALSARQANLRMGTAIDSLLAMLEKEQFRVGTSAFSRGAIANAMLEEFQADGSGDTDLGQRGTRFDQLLARAATASVGADVSPDTAAKYLTTVADHLRSNAGTPGQRAQSLLIEGRAAELRQNYDAAADAYERAFDIAPKDDRVAFEAATNLIMLHRRSIPAERISRQAEWCQTAAGTMPKPSMTVEGSENERADAERTDFATAQLCLIAVAVWKSALGDDASAQDIVSSIGELAWPKDGGDFRYEHHLLQLQLRAQADMLTLGKPVDEMLLKQLKAQLDANPNTEEASGLYAAALDATDANFGGAFEIRRPLLKGDPSTGYLIDAVPGMWLLEQRLSGDDETNAQAFAADRTGGVSEDFTRQSKRLEAEIKHLEVLAALGSALTRLDKRSAMSSLPGFPLPKIPEFHVKEMDLPRRQQLEEAQKKFATHLGPVTSGLREFADRNGLAADLARSPRVHLTEGDRAQIGEVQRLFEIYREACSPVISSSEEPCGSEMRGLTVILEPMLRRAGQYGTVDAVPTQKGEGKFLIDGYDPVSYWKNSGSGESMPLRGDDDLALSDGRDGLILFANPGNRDSFRSSPERYMPAFGGLAADWAAIGERKPANPRLACIVSSRLLLFAEVASWQSWCGQNGRATPDGDPSLAALEAAWHADAKPVFDAPDGSQQAITPRSRDTKIFAIAPGREIHAPAGGAVTMESGYLRIEHSDGRVSELTIAGGRFRPLPIPRALRPRGANLPYDADPGASVMLRWRMFGPPSRPAGTATSLE